MVQGTRAVTTRQIITAIIHWHFFSLQADIAALMSSVIGVPYPMNSVVSMVLSLKTLCIDEEQQ